MNKRRILIGYRDKAVWFFRPNSVRFLFVGLDEERSLQTSGENAKRNARCDFGCCFPHTETWRSAQTKKTQSSHTSFKVRWGWRWDFRIFIVNC